MAKERPAEFPSDWHQEAYVDGLGRELDGYRRRMAELDAVDLPDTDPAYEDAKAGEAAVLAELRRLGQGQESASKRSAAKSSTEKGK